MLAFMVALVSTFLHVGGPPYRYAFIFAAWDTFYDEVRNELTRQAHAFGGALGGKGIFVQPFPERMHEAANEVLGKQWPDALRQRLDDSADPIILIIDQEFAQFDPREHGYAIIWLGDYHSEPEAIRPLLQVLAQKTRRDEDVIGYLRDVAEKVQDDARRTELDDAVGTAARIASYVEVKPTLFGVSIDLKAILRDIAQRK